MRFIEVLKDGDRVSDVYLCKSKATAMTKNGKEYESVVLQDRTGSLDGKIWDPGSMGIGEYEALDYVEVSGSVISYNGALQLKIDRLRRAGEGEYDPADYMRVSPYSIDEMFAQLTGYIKTIDNVYVRKLLESFFVEDAQFIADFKKHSAAKSIHHGYLGGLLEHSLSVTRLCDYLASSYPLLNRDLLVACAMLHDVGKVAELSDFPQNDYTDEGNLLGHIVMGSEMVGERIRAIEGFPRHIELEIKHCILSHHGELEFGSPKKPELAEALALSMADNLDAKLQTMKELFDAKAEVEWLGYNKLFESNIKRTRL
jgi:3'-5' exoribonuclease